MIESIRIGFEERFYFQDHMVLVDLGIHRVDLPLAEGVIQDVINSGWCDAKARCGDTVDGQRDGQAARLLIGGDAVELRVFLQAIDETIGPQSQFIGIGILERVLVLRATYPVIHRDILDRGHIK